MRPDRSLSKKEEIIVRQYGRERDYWLARLSGGWVKSGFPRDHDRAVDGPRDLKSVEFRLTDETSARLLELSGGLDQRLHMVLTAGLLILLHRFSGNDDIIVGVPIYRQEKEGEFINTVLALRNDVSAFMSVRDLLLQVRQNIRGAAEHQNYPIETLLYQLNLPPSDHEFPLFDAAILLENIHDKRYLQHIPLQMIWSFVRSHEKVGGRIDYNGALYMEAFIEHLIDYFQRLLGQGIFDIDLKIGDLDPLSGAQRRQILEDFNSGSRAYPADKTVDALFGDQARQTPHHIAVVSGQGALTYGELNRRAHRLAGALADKGIGDHMVAAIMVEHGLTMALGILAILKVGAAYLPLAVEYPEERKRYILGESRAAIWLSDCPPVESYGTEVLDMNGAEWYGADRAVTTRHHAASLAYIMYTSGSTGAARGVMVAHRNVIRLVKNTNYVDFNERERILQTGALEFDASTFEIWGALLNGLELTVVSKEEILGHETLKEAIRRCGITLMWMTAPLFNQVLDADVETFAGLTTLLVGGDVLSPGHIRRLQERFPHLRLINGYGPTENTTFSTTHLIQDTEVKRIPIGRPVANSTAYVVDRSGHLLPPGIPGELWVGGDGVARGYLNNPELTAEKFINLAAKARQGTRSPTSSHFTVPTDSPLERGAPEGRGVLYKTGDLCRFLPDGNIDFLGRMDHQVKIRGYRVEPGEIENQLLRHHDVGQAVVIAVGEPAGDKSLCAYIAPPPPNQTNRTSRTNRTNKTNRTSPTQLRQYLSRTLPDYMIPGHFMVIDRLPLNANGKLDRQALPRPELDGGGGGETVPPRDALEARMTEIWSSILGIRKTAIGIDADFFELGGHSLRATILISQLAREFDVKVPLARIFEKPTIRELAAYIREAAGGDFMSIRCAEKREYYPLSSAQQRIYFQQHMDEGSVHYNVSEAVECLGPLERTRMEETFEAMIRRHECFRTSFFTIHGQPMQRIHERVEPGFEYDETSRETGLPESDWLSGKINRFIRPFDLGSPPLLRVGLLKIEDQRHLLMLDVHHIVMDGTSIGIFIRDFAALYRGEVLAKPRIQYRDYALWQHSRWMQGRLKQQEQYWLKELSGAIPLSKIPTDFKRPKLQRFEGDALEFELDPSTTGQLKALAADREVTMFMLLLALFGIMLSKVCLQEEVMVGTAIAARRHADLEEVIGMFVNTLALKIRPAGDRSFPVFLDEVKKKTMEAYENQEFQFEELVKRVMADRDLGRNPLFDAMLVLQNMDISALELPGVRLRLRRFEIKASLFDLCFLGAEAGDRVRFRVLFSTNLFSPGRIDRFIGYFKEVVSQVLACRDIRLKEIAIAHDLKEPSAEGIEEAKQGFGF